MKKHTEMPDVPEWEDKEEQRIHDLHTRFSFLTDFMHCSKYDYDAETLEG